MSAPTPHLGAGLQGLLPTGLEARELTPEELTFFWREGYLIIRNVIPDYVADAAQMAINHQMGKHV
eukprot:gene17566-5494_t